MYTDKCITNVQICEIEPKVTVKLFRNSNSIWQTYRRTGIIQHLYNEWYHFRQRQVFGPKPKNINSQPYINKRSFFDFCSHHLDPTTFSKHDMNSRRDRQHHNIIHSILRWPYNKDNTILNVDQNRLLKSRTKPTLRRLNWVETKTESPVSARTETETKTVL